MRVLHLIPSIDPAQGGMSSALRGLVEGSEAAGIESHVVTLDPPGMPWLQTWQARVSATGPGHTRFAWAPHLAPLLNREVPTHDALVVHGLWQYHNLAAFNASRTSRTPVLVFLHGMLDPWALRQSLVKRLNKAVAWPLVTAPLLRRADRLCFTCDEELTAATPALKAIPFTPAIVAPGVEPCPDSPEILSSELRQAEPSLADRRILLFLGRLHPKKGCSLLVKGFAQWRQSLDEKTASRFHLRMAGPPCSPSYLRILENLASAHGLIADRDISFPGMRQGRAKWQELAACEAMILPSHQENFGMVVGEALACGKPVLLSNQVNTWPWIKEYEAGFVAPDTQAGVVSLLSEWSAAVPQGSASLASNALRLYQDRFSIPVRAQEFAALIRSLQPS